VHADVCGPMSVESLGGSRYFLLFTDDYSQMSWVYFLKFKSEVFENFKRFKALVEKQSGCPIVALRSDRGGEFTSNEFATFCEKNEIHREMIAPCTPEQNGVAQRKNQTVVEMTRSIMNAVGLLKKLWAEAVAAVVYILNISPTKAVMNQTPNKAWKDRRPRVSHLKIFGCIAYALDNSQSRRKLNVKSTKCIFVGYSPQPKAYKLYNPMSGKVIISRDVVFHESVRWDWGEEQVPQSIHLEVSAPEKHEPTPTTSPEGTSATSPAHSPNRDASPAVSVEAAVMPTSPQLRRSTRDRRLNPRYADNVYTSCAFALLVSDPLYFEEATKEPEWCKAMEKELWKKSYWLFRKIRLGIW